MKYTAEEVRALFESWAEENGYDVLRIGPDYNDGFTAAAWHGYQAAYAERIEADEVAAQSVGVIPEGCIAVPRSLVERWANVDAFNAPVGAAMELRVIAGEMLVHAAALQEKGNG